MRLKACPGSKLLSLCHAHEPHWRGSCVLVHKQIDFNRCSKFAEPPPCEFAIPWAQAHCETLHLLSYCNKLASRQLLETGGDHLPTSRTCSPKLLVSACLPNMPMKGYVVGCFYCQPNGFFLWIWACWPCFLAIFSAEKCSSKGVALAFSLVVSFTWPSGCRPVPGDECPSYQGNHPSNGLKKESHIVDLLICFVLINISV